MRIKLLTFCTALLASIQPLSAVEINRLPEEFSITERFFSMTSTFDIATPLGPYATARKRFFSWTTTFDLEDAESRPLAYAKAKFFSWGTSADVFDPAEKKLGWIEEVTWKLIPWPEYRLFNSYNQLAAVATLNFWGNRFDIFEPDNSDQIYAVIKRPFIRIFRDCWTAEIHRPDIFETGMIDSRLLIMLAVYQTDRENRERLRAEIQSQLMEEADGGYWTGAVREENDSLTALLSKVDALGETISYTSEAEAEADLQTIARLKFSSDGEQIEPLDIYRRKLESLLSALEREDLTDTERQALIRLTKEYKNI